MKDLGFHELRVNPIFSLSVYQNDMFRFGLVSCVEFFRLTVMRARYFSLNLSLCLDKQLIFFNDTFIRA